MITAAACLIEVEYLALSIDRDGVRQMLESRLGSSGIALRPAPLPGRLHGGSSKKMPSATTVGAETYAPGDIRGMTPPGQSCRRIRKWSKSVMPYGSGRSGAARSRARCGRWEL